MKDKNISDRTRLIISFLLVGLLSMGVYFALRNTPKELDYVEKIHTTDSELVSTDPIQTAVNFIVANGTMGDIKEEVSIETLKSYEALFNNAARRLEALELAEKALIPGSPLLQGNERINIKSHAKELGRVIFYRVENVSYSEVENKGKLKTYSGDGSNYNSLDIYVSFDSIKTYYDKCHDLSWDGTYDVIENKVNFKDIKVTLVQSGDLWFVFDIEDAEKIINSRFATWSGIGSQTTTFESDIIVDYIKDESFSSEFTDKGLEEEEDKNE